MKKAAMVFLLSLVLLAAVGCGKQEQPAMATVDDLANKKIGVYTGTIYDKFAVDRFPSATILRYNHSTDFPIALKTGKVDAAISNLYSAKTLVKANPEIGILSDELLNFPIGIGFSKNNPVLRERFNAYLKSIKADGSYDVMYKKWFEGDAEKAAMPNFPVITGGEKITLAVATGDMPSVGYVNGEYVGFDIEMVQTFAQKEHIELTIVSMEFGGLIAALAAGKADMIADCIAINEERKKQVAFSEPYMEDKSAVIALRKNIAHLAHTEDGQQVSFAQSVTDGFYNNIIHENRYLLVVDGLKTTGVISVFSILFGTLLGGLICFLRMSRHKAASLFARFYVSLVRGIPVLVLLMILYYVVFAKININPVLVAVAAFGINFAAYVSEMFRSAIESIDKGQTEAGIANGFSKVQTFLYIVFPQAVKQVMPVYKGELISLVKMTSIVGYVAVQDLTKASDIIRSRTFDAFFPLIMTALLYFLISWLLLSLLEYVEKKTDPRHRRRRTANQSR